MFGDPHEDSGDVSEKPDIGINDVQQTSQTGIPEDAQMAMQNSTSASKDEELPAVNDGVTSNQHGGPDHQGGDAVTHATEQSLHKPVSPDTTVLQLIEKADYSAGKLVNLLAKYFPCFRDEARFEDRRVRFLKRAQIFVADLWAALRGTGYGAFDDIERLTMFAGKCDMG